MSQINSEVTTFLDNLNHPLRGEIELLRKIIMNSCEGLNENIKWNGPNYSFNGDDRITMRIQPPKQIQLIFHRGAKKQAQPKSKLIEDNSGLLVWKENDRAVLNINNIYETKRDESKIAEIASKWIEATGLI